MQRRGRRTEHEPGAPRALDDAQEEPLGDRAVEVRDGDRQHDDGAPDEYEERESFRQGEALQDKRDRQHANDVAPVEGGGAASK